jgi:hypothetical protein
VRRDHLAGLSVAASAVVILALSGDLPFGTLASPGAGMLPKLVLGLMLALGVVILAAGRGSPQLAALDWSDLPHARRVLIVAVLATAGYATLGFLITMSAMLFALTCLAERQRLVPSLAFSVLVPVATFLMFEYVLKAPLERGLLRL